MIWDFGEARGDRVERSLIIGEIALRMIRRRPTRFAGGRAGNGPLPAKSSDAGRLRQSLRALPPGAHHRPTARRKGSSNSRMTSMSASGVSIESITAWRSPATSSSTSPLVCVSRNLTTRSGWRACSCGAAPCPDVGERKRS